MRDRHSHGRHDHERSEGRGLKNEDLPALAHAHILTRSDGWRVRATEKTAGVAVEGPRLEATSGGAIHWRLKARTTPFASLCTR